MKKWLITLLCGLLLLYPFSMPLSAEEQMNEENHREGEKGTYQTKDEVIYGNLDLYGQPKNLYVVNSFHVTSPGYFIDYGTYTDVRNLTNLMDIEQIDGHQIRFYAEEGEFYYQGELEGKTLPWDFTLTYLFNGEEVNPKEIAGQSGKLEIHIETSAREDVDPLFFEHYLLQISLTLDPEIFKDIQAPKGTEANAGKDKQISFTVLPEQEGEFIVSAQVSQFEMDPIEFSAVPANIAFDSPDVGDMTEGFTTLSDAIREINKGVTELNRGIEELHGGTTELSKGSTQFKEGMVELNQSSPDLVEGSREIKNALKSIEQGLMEAPDMPDVSELEKLPQTLREIAKGLGGIAERFEDLQEGFDHMRSDLEEAIDRIPNRRLSEKDVEELYASDLSSDTIETLMENYAAAQTIRSIYENDRVQGIYQAVADILKGIPEEMKRTESFLHLLADGMEGSLGQLDELEALQELQDGLQTLASEYENFHDGLMQFTGGVGDLTSAYDELDEGIQELPHGTSQLRDGANLLKEGTNELYEETSDLPDQMESEIDKFLEEYDFADFTPTSFVSEKNKDVEVVQFVLQTERIKAKEDDGDEVVEGEKKSLWKRFLDLFR